MKKKIIVLAAAFALSFAVFFPKHSEAALGDTTLSKGTWHNDVNELQESLLSKSVYPYHEATGYFGTITEQAVKDFQSKNGLKADGIAGSQTYSKLKVVKYGDQGRPVIKLQRLLKAWNQYTGSVDGIYGNATKKAVQSFQEQHGFPSDGVAGAQTLKKLNEKSNEVSSNVKELTVSATAYTASCEGCSGVTKMGVDLNKYPDGKVIAVDPNVIPLGSTVEVEGYGKAIAADIGGAIDGNEIDVFISDLSDAEKWGVKNVKVKVYE
ncbi:peptidoglycan-binding protein [Metabacillus arenae]